MSADFSIKPVGASVATPLVRPAPEAARTAVHTELPADKSVTASSNSAAATPAATYDAGALTEISHQVIIDRAAAQIVYVTIDKTTSQVVDQYPEESKLRARAYLRAQDDAKFENKLLATDRSA
jgi:hypothetical protein